MFAGMKKFGRAIIDAPDNILDRLTSKWVLVVGHSMHPTLRDGQRVRVSRRAYRLSEPARWDVVLFEHPERERFWETKRIVGLPGEVVRLVGDRLHIDDVEVGDPFVHGIQRRMDRNWNLRADEFIVLGDNRRRSTDSRSFGPVVRRNIAGKVIIDDGEVDETLS